MVYPIINRAKSTSNICLLMFVKEEVMVLMFFCVSYDSQRNAFKGKRICTVRLAKMRRAKTLN